MGSSGRDQHRGRRENPKLARMERVRLARVRVELGNLRPGRVGKAHGGPASAEWRSAGDSGLAPRGLVAELPWPKPEPIEVEAPGFENVSPRLTPLRVEFSQAT